VFVLCVCGLSALCCAVRLLRSFPLVGCAGCVHHTYCVSWCANGAMGSLSFSIKFERESQRLPPLDADRLAYLNQRRVAANAAVLRMSTTKLASAGTLAKHQAERRAAELKSWAMMESSCDEKLRRSRQQLSRSSTTGSLSRARSAKAGTMLEGGEQRMKEAMRETARDCVRREELARRMQRAKSASDLARGRAEALEMQREEEQSELLIKQQKEADRLERKLEVEQERLNRSVSFGNLREEERQAHLKQLSLEQAKVLEERAALAKAREERQNERKQKAEREELQRELVNERRRKEKADMQVQLIAAKARDLAAKAESCWIGAIAGEAKCRADLEAEEARLQLLRASGHSKDLSLEQLGKLQRKVEMARQRAECARLSFRALAYWATHPDRPRPSRYATDDELE
jgi:hypothetical protein